MPHATTTRSPACPIPPVAPPPLHYRSTNPTRSRGQTARVVAVCVLYGLLAVPLFALAIFMLWIFAFDRANGPVVTIVSLASAALFIGLAVLLVRWMIKYIRSVSQSPR